MARAFFRISLEGGAYVLVPKRHILAVAVSSEGAVTVFVLNVTNEFTITDPVEITAFMRWLEGAPARD